jgi:hypothetical protein
MKFLTKLLTVPWSNETEEVEAVQLWEVRWESIHGDIGKRSKPEVEAFTSEEEAETFATSLRNATKLLRHGYDANTYNGEVYGRKVIVQKAK